LSPRSDCHVSRPEVSVALCDEDYLAKPRIDDGVLWDKESPTRSRQHFDGDEISGLEAASFVLNFDSDPGRPRLVRERRILVENPTFQALGTHEHRCLTTLAQKAGGGGAELGVNPQGRGVSDLVESLSSSDVHSPDQGLFDDNAVGWRAKHHSVQ